MLFDNFEREEFTPDTSSKSLFQDINLYDRYGTTNKIRNNLEAWFKKYPLEHQKELRERFRSTDNHHHRGAYFELFLHELLTTLGFSLTIHPEFSGTSTSPDFLADKDNQRFYLEATAVGPDSGPFTKNKNELDVLDKLNELSSPHFRITYDMQGTLSRTLSRKNRNEVVSSIKKLLDSHDPDEVQLRINKHGRNEAPSKRISVGEWSFEAWLSPIAPEDRGNDPRHPLILGHHRAKSLNCFKPIKKALTKKKKKYGNLDAPLIVAVHTLDQHYPGPEHDMEVLFGQGQLIYSKDQPDLPPEFGRQQNGIWSSDCKIDAFWSFQSIDVWNMWYSASACLYLSPMNPNVILPDALFRLPHAKVNGDQMEWSKGQDIKEIMQF